MGYRPTTNPQEKHITLIRNTRKGIVSPLMSVINKIQQNIAIRSANVLSNANRVKGNNNSGNIMKKKMHTMCYLHK